MKKYLQLGLVRVVIMLCCVYSEKASSQQVFAGDSVRLRNARESLWNSGRLLRQDNSTFTLQSGPDTLRLAIADLQRVERWKRNDRNLVWVAAAVGMIGGTLAYYLTPEEEEHTGGGCVITGVSSVCTTTTTKRHPGNLRAMQALGAVGGVAMGFVALQVWPGQWKIVFDR